jgi:poly(A) polymerase
MSPPRVKMGPEFEPVQAAITAAARTLGCRAYLVGGVVRDLLLGRPTQPDVDVVVDGGQGIVLATAVAQALGAPAPFIHERFGVAQLRVGALRVEFVSARAERYDRDSRKPHVRPGTIEEDAWRRDFTMNALLLDEAGGVQDPTGRGLKDLTARRIATPLPPAETFDEDPLRMLRAVRFAATLEFTLAPEVIEGIRLAAARLSPPVVSVERIAEELRKLMLAPRPSVGWRLLEDSGLLNRLVPELLAGKGVEQGGFHSYDVYGHNLAAMDLMPAGVVERWAGLLHDVGKPATRREAAGKISFLGHQEEGAQMAESILRRLRFANEEAERVATLVRLHMRPIQYDPAGWQDSAVKRLIRDAGEALPQLLALARADMGASHYPGADKLDHLEARIEALDAARVRALRPPVDGNAIMARFGLPPGPAVKRAKALLEEALIDGRLEPDPEAALQLLARERERWERAAPAPPPAAEPPGELD